MNDELIWAPWRIGYIAGGSEAEAPEPAPARLMDGGEAECFLCQAAGIPASTADDRVRLVLRRTEDAVVVLNRYPYNNGHLLVAPRAHVARLDEIDMAVHAALMATLGRFVELYERLMHAEGFNVGLNLGRVAGAGVPGHLHWHLVPRFSGDHNFMPTIAGARVIPQALDALWEAINAELNRTDISGDETKK
jgi:ATP adenylyltransferase